MDDYRRKSKVVRRLRRRLRGGNLQDDINDLINKLKNEFENPNSLTRQGLDKVSNELTNPDSLFNKGIRNPQQTWDKIKNEFENPNSLLGQFAKQTGQNLENTFDPEKNGIAAAFRKFGKDTEAAFEEVGRKIREQMARDKEAIDKAFEPVKEYFKDSLANESWWRETMSDPSTYILLAQAMLQVASTVALFVPIAGPVALMAMGIASSALGMINKAIKNEPIDAFDIADLALSCIPIPAAPATKTWSAFAKQALVGASKLTTIQRAVYIGKNISGVGRLVRDEKQRFDEKREAEKIKKEAAEEEAKRNAASAGQHLTDEKGIYTEWGKGQMLQLLSHNDPSGRWQYNSRFNDFIDLNATGGENDEFQKYDENGNYTKNYIKYLDSIGFIPDPYVSGGIVPQRESWVDEKYTQLLQQNKTTDLEVRLGASIDVPGFVGLVMKYLPPTDWKVDSAIYKFYDDNSSNYRLPPSNGYFLALARQLLSNTNLGNEQLKQDIEYYMDDEYETWVKEHPTESQRIELSIDRGAASPLTIMKHFLETNTAPIEVYDSHKRLDQDGTNMRIQTEIRKASPNATLAILNIQDYIDVFKYLYSTLVPDGYTVTSTTDERFTPEDVKAKQLMTQMLEKSPNFRTFKDAIPIFSTPSIQGVPLSFWTYTPSGQKIELTGLQDNQFQNQNSIDALVHDIVTDEWYAPITIFDDDLTPIEEREEYVPEPSYEEFYSPEAKAQLAEQRKQMTNVDFIEDLKTNPIYGDHYSNYSSTPMYSHHKDVGRAFFPIFYKKDGSRVVALEYGNTITEFQTNKQYNINEFISFNDDDTTPLYERPNFVIAPEEQTWMDEEAKIQEETSTKAKQEEAKRQIEEQTKVTAEDFVHDLETNPAYGNYSGAFILTEAYGSLPILAVIPAWGTITNSWTYTKEGKKIVFDFYAADNRPHTLNQFYITSKDDGSSYIYSQLITFGDSDKTLLSKRPQYVAERSGGSREKKTSIIIMPVDSREWQFAMQAKRQMQIQAHAKIQPAERKPALYSTNEIGTIVHRVRTGASRKLYKKCPCGCGS